MVRNINRKIVVLGTGGTIAGTSDKAGDNIGYTAAQVGVAQLISAIPAFAELLNARKLALESEQIAQIDSKDMAFSVWLQLASRVAHHLAQEDVHGVLVTHGTDTLEETAFFLHCVLPRDLLAAKPVVLTCAMRPATALTPDGPQNMLDAMAVALTDATSGVVVVCAGSIHSAVDVQKVHTYRVDAFSSGDAGPLGYVEEGRVRWVRNGAQVPASVQYIAIDKVANLKSLPRVEWVTSHADASGDMVDALVAHAGTTPERPLRGLVVAGTGNGTIHYELEAALLRAQAAGVRVVLATRCALGIVLPTPHGKFQDSRGLSPAKARLALMLALANDSGNCA